MSLLKTFLVIALFIIVLSQSLFSKIELQGFVLDQGSEPVANAVVKLINQVDTSIVLSCTTCDSGYYCINIIDTEIRDNVTRIPAVFNLLQNYPNPFNPSTVITYELPYPSEIRIEIFNVLGQRIRTLHDGFVSDLFGRFIWDGTNDLGRGVAAGVYFYSLTTKDGTRIIKKMLMLDGYLFNKNLVGAITNQPVQTGIYKPSSNHYWLCVEGDNIKSCEQNIELSKSRTLNIIVTRICTDIDGNIYSIVKIGDQWWMAENLRVTQYRNGESITNALGNLEWSNLTQGAYCYFANDNKHAATYGALYNWQAVSDIRNIAPEGWHVPSDEDWKQLEVYLGMSREKADDDNEARSINEGGRLKEEGTIHWQSPNTGATNSYGFTALPGGFRDFSGLFTDLNFSANFWTATPFGSNYAWCRKLNHNDAHINRYSFNNKLCGFSIRLVKD